MYNTRLALINHLQQSTALPAAATVKRYAGEIQQASLGNINLPAILVLARDGQPIHPVPQMDFSLLFVTETQFLEKEEGEKDALLFTQAHAEWLVENQTFEDAERYYRFINLESATIRTVLSDYKYTILDLVTSVKVQR